MIAPTICLRCRFLIGDGRPCLCASDVAGPRVVVTDPTGRARLIGEVWGPEPGLTEAERERLRNRHASGDRGFAVGAVIGGVLAVASTIVLADTSLAGLVFAAGAAGGGAIGRRRADPRRVRYPVGAIAPDLTHRRYRATVVAAEPCEAPLPPWRCPAWSIELRCAIGVAHHRVVLRAGSTGRLDLALDDGQRARIDAGAIWVVPATTSATASGAFLRTIDPGWGGPGPDPFPVDETGASVVAVGDRIELAGDLIPVFEQDTVASYRDAPSAILVPSGLPIITRVG